LLSLPAGDVALDRARSAALWEQAVGLCEYYMPHEPAAAAGAMAPR
jgi:hypothetical protein